MTSSELEEAAETYVRNIDEKLTSMQKLALTQHLVKFTKQIQGDDSEIMIGDTVVYFKNNPDFPMGQIFVVKSYCDMTSTYECLTPNGKLAYLLEHDIIKM